MGLYPGTSIAYETPEWLEVRRSRWQAGEPLHRFAMAHRLNPWARTGEGEAAYGVLRCLLEHGTLPNLWDTCAPFQIDGNLGGTVGIA